MFESFQIFEFLNNFNNIKNLVNKFLPAFQKNCLKYAWGRKVKSAYFFPFLYSYFHVNKTLTISFQYIVCVVSYTHLFSHKLLLYFFRYHGCENEMWVKLYIRFFVVSHLIMNTEMSLKLHFTASHFDIK